MIEQTSQEKMSSDLHKGHRERLRQRFINTQGHGLNDHELLELLLFYTHSRINTNEIAHQLIDKYGSLREVVNATPEKICSVKGVGKQTAIFFEILTAVNRRIRMEKYFAKKPTFKTLSSVGEFLLEHYNGANREELYAMFLDSSMKLIDFRFIASGSSDGLCFDIKSFARTALDYNAEFVILSHNHPGGEAVPSSSDREKTALVEATLSAIGIGLLEHIIVSDVAYSPTMQSRVRGNRGDIHTLDANYERISRFYNE
jgi:DNA repair protein RadC